MALFSAFGRVCICFAAGTCLALAQPTPSPAEHGTASWLESLLKTPIPKFRTYVPLLQTATSNCSVSPLSEIDEPGAASFEANSGTFGIVDISGLTQATANALSRLQHMVASIGGRLDIKSAYRPPAYQEHLQEVWDKWKMLRYNRQAGCQALRAQVSDEFKRHTLLVTQRPVSDSDHTRGVGIDAALVLPRGARWNRRRISLDRLAKMVGFQRPDIRHDPVHFRLLAAFRDEATTVATY